MGLKDDNEYKPILMLFDREIGIVQNCTANRIKNQSRRMSCDRTLMQSESRLKEITSLLERKREPDWSSLAIPHSFLSQNCSLSVEGRTSREIFLFADSRFGFQFSVHQLPVVYKKERHCRCKYWTRPSQRKLFWSSFYASGNCVIITEGERTNFYSHRMSFNKNKGTREIQM